MRRKARLVHIDTLQSAPEPHLSKAALTSSAARHPLGCFARLLCAPGGVAQRFARPLRTHIWSPRGGWASLGAQPDAGVFAGRPSALAALSDMRRLLRRHYARRRPAGGAEGGGAAAAAAAAAAGLAGFCTTTARSLSWVLPGATAGRRMCTRAPTRLSTLLPATTSLYASRARAGARSATQRVRAASRCALCRDAALHMQCPPWAGAPLGEGPRRAAVQAWPQPCLLRSRRSASAAPAPAPSQHATAHTPGRIPGPPARGAGAAPAGRPSGKAGGQLLVEVNNGGGGKQRVVVVTGAGPRLPACFRLRLLFRFFAFFCDFLSVPASVCVEWFRVC